MGMLDWEGLGRMVGVGAVPYMHSIWERGEIQDARTVQDVYAVQYVRVIQSMLTVEDVPTVYYRYDKQGEVPDKTPDGCPGRRPCSKTAQWVQPNQPPSMGCS